MFISDSIDDSTFDTTFILNNILGTCFVSVDIECGYT